MTRRLRVLAPAVVLCITLALPASALPGPLPVPPVGGFAEGGDLPAMEAPAWLLFDEATDRVLGSANANNRRPMASITKIMTGLIAIENTEPGDLVTVSDNAAATGEKEIDLVAGETVTMDALFKSLIIHSANDAATAIAEHIGGSVPGFVALMNQRAVDLGLSNTSFANPHGLDAPNHFTTAADMLELSRVAMADPYFRDVARASIVVMPTDPEGNERIGRTTNLLITGATAREGFPAVNEYDGTVGVKTGFTSQAQNTYVAAAERNGRMLYAVVLGAEGPRSHLFEAEKLFDYGFDNFPWSGPIALGTDYVPQTPRIEPEPLFVQRDVEAYIHLAGQGLLLAEPAPLLDVEDVEPPPIPVVEVSRSAETGPKNVWDTIVFWFDRLLSSG